MTTASQVAAQAKLCFRRHCQTRGLIQYLEALPGSPLLSASCSSTHASSCSLWRWAYVLVLVCSLMSQCQPACCAMDCLPVMPMRRVVGWCLPLIRSLATELQLAAQVSSCSMGCTARKAGSRTASELSMQQAPTRYRLFDFPWQLQADN